MSLYIKETGKNSDETILFLHGDGIAGWMWDKQIESFSDYHCIAVDGGLQPESSGTPDHRAM